MDFNPLTLDRAREASRFFDFLESRTCDYSIGGMFMWRDFYRMEYTVEDGIFLTRLRDEAGAYHYSLPAGKDVPRGIRLCMEHAAEQGRSASFCTVPEEYLPLFRDLGRPLKISEQEDFSDYLYSYESLSTLAGRHYSGVRNHIHHFERENPEWSFEPLREHLDEARQFFEEYNLANQKESAAAHEESEKVREVLEHMDDYGFEGGVLLVPGAVAGFTLGEVIRDTLYVHIEKGDKRIPGSYQMLSNQFLKSVKRPVSFVNREEDMGDPGLRKAKLELRPTAILKKYMVEVR